MRPSVLPPNPNLEHLKKQAKDFLKSYRSGKPDVCSALREYLPRFAQAFPQEDALKMQDFMWSELELSPKGTTS